MRAYRPVITTEWETFDSWLPGLGATNVVKSQLKIALKSYISDSGEILLKWCATSISEIKLM